MSRVMSLKLGQTFFPFTCFCKNDIFPLCENRNHRHFYANVSISLWFSSEDTKEAEPENSEGED